MDNALQESKLGRNCNISIPSKLDVTFVIEDYGAKYQQNSVRIATVGQVTERHTDAVDFIICPMLKYSNGTDTVLCFCRGL